jgi:hypothetical protein
MSAEAISILWWVADRSEVLASLAPDLHPTFLALLPWCELVPTHADARQMPPYCGRCSTQVVLSMSHSFEVCNLNARTNPAPVVKLEPGRDRTNLLLPRHAMGHERSTLDTDRSVASVVQAEGKQETSDPHPRFRSANRLLT